jgi:hypothetical protein
VIEAKGAEGEAHCRRLCQTQTVCSSKGLASTLSAQRIHIHTPATTKRFSAHYLSRSTSAVVGTLKRFAV